MKRLRFLVLAYLLLLPATRVVFGQTGITYSVFPQIAVGDGWSFDVFVTNQDGGTANGVRLSFFTDSGTPFTASTNLGGNSSFTFNLAGGATQTIRVANEGALRAGYAVLEAPSEYSVRGSLVIRQVVAGQVVTQLGVIQQSPTTNYTFPAEVQVAPRINTGLALALPTLGGTVTGAANIIVSLIDESGNVQRMLPIQLNAGSHQASFFDQIFTGLTQFRGSVSVSSTVPFGLIALRDEQWVFGTLAINRGPVAAPFMVAGAAGAEVEPNNSTAQATSLALPAKVSGVIGSAGDVDYFSFVGNAGDIVTAQTDTRPFGFTADTVLTLFRSDGTTVICSNDQNGLLGSNDSFIQAVLPAVGTYYLRVEEWTGNGGSGYGYQLHVRISGNLPTITTITPNSATVGNTVGITIPGTNLSGASAINFSPATGITIANIVSTATQVTANVIIAGTAATGVRTVTVTTPAGTSNALNFTLNAGTPTGQPPTISNLSVGTPYFSGGGANIDISFDWADPDGDIIYVQGNFDGSAKLIFTKTGCTSRSSASWLHRPGQTSGRFSFTRQMIGSYYSGNFTINLQLQDAAGNISNTLTFSTTVWNCLLLRPTQAPDRDRHDAFPGSLPGILWREVWLAG
jgi:hypothetical protein